MKQYVAPIYDGDYNNLDAFPRITPSHKQFYSDDATICPDIVMELDADRYFLVSGINMKSEQVIGYVKAEKKYGKLQKDCQDIVAQIDNKSGPTLVTKKPCGKVIGYLQTQEENSYIAVTRPQPFIPIILIPVFFVTVVVCIYFFWSPVITPQYGVDELIDGGLTPTITAQLDPTYFNLKINATPIIKDGSMNIRIENSDRNLYDCYVEVEMEQSGTAEIIYKSPLIKPEQALEYATVDVSTPSGVYNGKANFQFYDDNSVLLGKATVKLIINIM